MGTEVFRFFMYWGIRKPKVTYSLDLPSIDSVLIRKISYITAIGKSSQ